MDLRFDEGRDEDVEAEQRSTKPVKVCIFLKNHQHPMLKLLSAEFYVPCSQTYVL